MFVAGLLEDWKRKLEEGRQRRNSNGTSRRQDYESFLCHQKSIWTPPELFEKCCPRFLAAGGLSSPLHNHHHHHHHHHHHPVQRRSCKDDGRTSWSCPGGCNKIHPTITLFFDTQKECTVAILSFRLDPFTTYFDGLVKDGVAICKTPFYYELRGYVRENLYKLTKHQKQEQQENATTLFGSHLVNVAMGALRESDIAQRTVLEKKHRQKQQQKQQSHNNNTSTATTTTSIQSYDHLLLEKVLQICTLHRLGDDLDVMSIHCMKQTSTVFRQIAVPLAQQRMKQTQLKITPLVDGYNLSGYSVFRRRNNINNDDNSRRTVIEREHGTMVEYAIGPSYTFEHVNNENTSGKYHFEKKTKKEVIDDDDDEMIPHLPKRRKQSFRGPVRNYHLLI